SPEEALQWRDSLEKLLQNPYGLASFRSFLRSEFNLILHYTFASNNSPRKVNIDHFTKAVTMKNLVEPSPSSFDMAQKRIFALMEKDSLPRFVRSEFYQELIK
ncbi:PREDICTED: regulator of G-protein signaling 5, partial [Fulmarus glacialis]|uniref:regulator of G-protein signaling 5 n=1 Tax=Fulmarus glacialis TaxID=30455 RepID=UPI00051BFA46